MHARLRRAFADSCAPVSTACAPYFGTDQPRVTAVFRILFVFASRGRHTRFDCDWSSDVCSSDLHRPVDLGPARGREHRDRRRPGRPAPPGRRTARAAGPRHRRTRAARRTAAARARPAVPRGFGQRLVPVGLRRRRPHHRRGQRRRSRRGRDLDGRRTVVRVRRGLASRCRTDARDAVMNGKLRVAAIGVALSVAAMLLLLVVRPSLDAANLRPLPLIIGAWLAFLVAAWLLRKVPKRTAVVLILLGGIGLQAVAVSVPRAFSNDLYRYMWDGQVQAAGIDPYQYVPTATQLTGLRNEFLFYPGAQYCVSPGYAASRPAAELTAGCTRINRPTVPTVLRRRWFTVAAAASGAFIAVYVPHVVRVGAKVVGFLPGYLQQENYTSGTRYGIIGLFIIGPLATVVALLILAAVALAVLQFSPPDRPWSGAVVMTAAALAVATPHYQWYSLLLVMLVALDGRPEWLAFAAGGYYAAYPALGARYHIPARLQDGVAYGVPLVVVAAGWLVRNELAKRAALAAQPEVAEIAVTEPAAAEPRSEEHTSELQSQSNLVCRLLLEKKK